jgi:hypothetical protein
LELQESHTPQLDCLLPIHIRQCNNLVNENSIPLFNERNFNDENPICFNQEFYRICPTIMNEEIHLPKLQVFFKIDDRIN